MSTSNAAPPAEGVTAFQIIERASAMLLRSPRPLLIAVSPLAPAAPTRFEGPRACVFLIQPDALMKLRRAAHHQRGPIWSLTASGETLFGAPIIDLHGADPRAALARDTIGAALKRNSPFAPETP